MSALRSEFVLTFIDNGQGRRQGKSSQVEHAGLNMGAKAPLD
jgi:hypothetical protein